MFVSKEVKVAIYLTIAVILASSLSLNANSKVFINEILANGINDPDSEWVELFNNETFEASLTNWSISETSSSNFTFNATMPANSFIILTTSYSTFIAYYPNAALSGIPIINITISSFNLVDSGGEVRLYNSSGNLVDLVEYAQASGKKFENVSIGRYPDASTSLFNLTTLTPGTKNDNLAPSVKHWIVPSGNNTKVSGIVNITINITDDTTQVNSTIISINGTNYSMLKSAKSSDLWLFLWNTSLNAQNEYNITIFFKDSYGRSSSESLVSILLNNSPFINSFSPASLSPSILENSTLAFSVDALEPNNDTLRYYWLIDGLLNSTNPVNFSYMPGFNDGGVHEINATIKNYADKVSIKWSVMVANVNNPPVLWPLQDIKSSKGVNLSFNITASDIDNDNLTFSSNHSKIKILNLNNFSAAVWWMPINKDIGVNVINFTVTDGFASDSKIISVEVDAGSNTAPNITSTPKTTAIVNEEYYYNANAFDFDGDILNYSLAANASGMSINRLNGVVRFTPSSAGFFAVNVSVSDFIDATSQSYNLTIMRGSMLKISPVDVKIDGETGAAAANNTEIGRNAEPGSDVEFKVNIKNTFSNEEGIAIKGISLSAKIIGIDDGDDLEESVNEFDLRAGEDKTSRLKFKVPLNADDTSFDVLIEAEGKDNNGNVYGQSIKTRLAVEKKGRKLRLFKFDLIPTAASSSCGIEASYGIMNIGEDEEKNILLEIKNEDLGLRILEDNISIDSGTEDNTFTKSIKLMSSKPISGTYQLTANVYSEDERLRDSKTAEISFDNCGINSEIKKDSAVENSLPLLQQSIDDAKNNELTDDADEVQKSPLEEANSSASLLVLGMLIPSMLFAFASIILFLRG